ncbi:unnamed protein product [Amoebophrya sp. A25]|nr:unnamed protein product [Amoebophrya sp. A25]|eukprot:GSA25T00009948001.1
MICSFSVTEFLLVREYRSMSADSECLLRPLSVSSWYEEHKAEFAPPICNRLMHKNQMTVMFVGGPNKRRDFHLDRGSEFFYQLKGNMKLPIILPGSEDKNELRIVEIKEGQVFLLPGCVPHSPQRPENDSLGMVVERERYDDEVDGLRYFEGFDFLKDEHEPENLNVDTILWERFFNCRSLADDLAPVVRAFNASEESKSNKAGDNVFSWKRDDASSTIDRTFEPKFPVNQKIADVPTPFSLNDFISKHRAELRGGASLSLFGDAHPDKEFTVLVGLPIEIDAAHVETCVLQVEGETELASVIEESTIMRVKKGECVVLPAYSKWKRVPESSGGQESQGEDSPINVALLIRVTPRKNAQFYGYGSPE